MSFRLDPHPIDVVADRLKPYLKAQGFRKTRLTWHRPGTESIAVIALERGRWGGSDFDLHIGAFYGRRTDSARPPYYACEAQTSWQRQLPKAAFDALRDEFNRIDRILNRGADANSDPSEFERLLQLGPLPVDPGEWQALPDQALQAFETTLAPLLERMSTRKGLQGLKAEGPVAHSGYFAGVSVGPPLQNEI